MSVKNTTVVFKINIHRSVHRSMNGRTDSCVGRLTQGFT